MMEVIPWAQLTQLGVGGGFSVVILFITFRFLSGRKNGTDKILLRMDASECKVANAMESIASAINNQTRLVEKMYDKQSDNHVEIIKEINHGSIRRSGSEVSKGTQ